MDPSGAFSLCMIINPRGRMFVKRVHHPLFFFPKVGPKDQQYFHAVERSLRKQGACFLRSEKNAEKSGMCGNLSRGGGCLCVYIYIFIFIHIYIYIWTPTKNGAGNFQVAVGKRLGDGRGSFEMIGV